MSKCKCTMEQKIVGSLLQTSLVSLLLIPAHILEPSSLLLGLVLIPICFISFFFGDCDD